MSVDFCDEKNLLHSKLLHPVKNKFTAQYKVTNDHKKQYNEKVLCINIIPNTTPTLKTITENTQTQVI